MKTKYFLWLFILDAILHLVTTVYALPMLNLITKPLLMILLAGYFVSKVGNLNNKIKYVVIAALVGSWFGDTFLMFQERNSMFFIFGLGSFLLAHLAYIMAFYKFIGKSNQVALISISLFFSAYSLNLLLALWPGLNDMLVPVIVYAAVLTVMGITGVVRNYGISNLIVIGVVLFIISDSLIAYNKFVEPVIYSRFSIMLTYISAQFLLIKGLSARMIKTYS